MGRRLLALLVLALVTSSPTLAAVPTQFIAKMYTEALGRAPDPLGWTSAVSYFQANGCDQADLASWGVSLLTSAEFAGLSYDMGATTLVLYRAILNREPDAAGFQDTYGALQQGESLQSVAQSLFDSSEFAQLVPAICSGSSYSFETLGTQAAMQIPTATSGGWGSLSESDLQNLLNSTAAGQSVYLQQESVVDLTQPLVIPAGVTLATYGLPTPTQHALMARLVRAAPFAAAMILINVDANPHPSGTIESLWIDGQRTATSTFVSGAINVEIYGGVGATVENNFISNSLGWSTVHSYGSLDGDPCSSNLIENNVITAYPSLHTDQEWTDGLSIGCENTQAMNNQVVDATDVGIVVYTAYPAVQQSVVSGNTVLSAGNSAFGALGFDPL